MTPLLNLDQEPPDKTSILIDEYSGEQLRSLLIQNSNMSWHQYLNTVGIKPQNAWNYLSGKLRISLAVLNKLLAASDLELQCQLSVQIVKRSGDNAPDVDYNTQDDWLYSTDGEQSTTESTETSPQENCPTIDPQSSS